MKKYLVDGIVRDRRILLTEDKIEKGICFEGGGVVYLIKDNIENVKEYVKILKENNNEEVSENLSSILECNEVEYRYLGDFITDEDIEKYIKEGYSTIYNVSVDEIEDIKELYSYNQEEYYIKNEYGEDKYYLIEDKEEVEYIKQLEGNVYGETLLYKNIDLENRYVYLSHYQNTEIEELLDFEVERILNKEVE